MRRTDRPTPERPDERLPGRCREVRLPLGPDVARLCDLALLVYPDGRRQVRLDGEVYDAGQWFNLPLTQDQAEAVFAALAEAERRPHGRAGAGKGPAAVPGGRATGP